MTRLSNAHNGREVLLRASPPRGAPPGLARGAFQQDGGHQARTFPCRAADVPFPMFTSLSPWKPTGYHWQPSRSYFPFRSFNPERNNSQERPQATVGVGGKAVIFLEQAERERWTLGAGGRGPQGHSPRPARGEVTQPCCAVGQRAFQSTRTSGTMKDTRAMGVGDICAHGSDWQTWVPVSTPRAQ